MENTKEQRIEQLNEAQEKLYEVIGLLEEAAGEDGNAQAYLIDHLKIAAGEGHGFCSNDLNIDKLRERIENECDYCGYDDCDGECQEGKEEQEARN